MRTLFLALALFVCITCTSARAAGPTVNPELPHPAASRLPKLLSDYERRVLSMEMLRLRKEIAAARALAAEDESLAPLKEALAAAKQGGNAAQIDKAKAALSDATEAILYKDEKIPAKTKRLLEVGAMLEYDTDRRRSQRASHPIYDKGGAK